MKSNTKTNQFTILTIAKQEVTYTRQNGIIFTADRILMSGFCLYLLLRYECIKFIKYKFQLIKLTKKVSLYILHRDCYCQVMLQHAVNKLILLTLL